MPAVLKSTLLLLLVMALPGRAGARDLQDEAGEHTESPEPVVEEAASPGPLALTPPAIPPTAWQRLSSNAGWKVAGFTFSFSVISLASDYDRESSDWAREKEPLGAFSGVLDRSPPFMLGGTLGALGGLSLLAPEATRPRHRKALEVFTVTQLINAGLTDLLKVAVARPRPDSGARSSFPSGHTSSAAAWATLLWRRYGWPVGLPATVFAVLVGASRIQDGRHYLSDVLAGALLGVSLTYVVDELYGP